MSCHAQVWNKSPLLGLVREYYFKDRPIPWNSVHNLPDFVYFNHAIHVNKGVGCVTCHGRVDQMALIEQKSPLSMGWCVDCHRNPEPQLRPVEFITSMTWQPAPGRRSAEARGAAGPAVQRPHADLLRRMPPMTTPRFPLPVLGAERPQSSPRRVDAPGRGELRTRAVTARRPSMATAGPTGAAWRSSSTATPRSPTVTRSSPPARFDAPKGFARRDFLQLMGASVALAGPRPPAPRSRWSGSSPTPRPRTGWCPAIRCTTPRRWCTTGIGLRRPRHQLGGPPGEGGGQPAPIRCPGARPAPHAQAELASLYDPFRARVLQGARRRPQLARLPRVDAGGRAAAWEKDGGAGLRFLLAPQQLAPHRASLRRRILQRFPKARFHAWSAIAAGHGVRRHRAGVRQAARAALYDFEKADIVLSLDADFLEAAPRHLDLEPQLRQPPRAEASPGLNRLYVVEPRFSITGGMADHRLRCAARTSRASRSPWPPSWARPLPALAGLPQPGAAPGDAREVRRRGREGSRGQARRRSWSSPVSGRPRSPTPWPTPSTRRSATSGTTVTFTEPAVLDTATGRAGWQSLVDELQAGKVDTLVITAWNPVFTAPGDVGSGRALPQEGAQRRLPRAQRRRDVAGGELVPPRGAPVRELGRCPRPRGHAVHRPAAHPAAVRRASPRPSCSGRFLTDEAKPYERLKSLHAARAKADFDTEWEVWLAERRGAGGTASPAVTPSRWRRTRVRTAAGQAPPAPAGVELDLVHDYKILDGRYSLNSWLQELPDPITKMTWDNVAQVGPGMAKQLEIENGDLLLLTVAGRSVQVPAWVQPGHADERGDRLAGLRPQAAHPRGEGRGRAGGGGPRRLPAPQRGCPVVRHRRWSSRRRARRTRSAPPRCTAPPMAAPSPCMQSVEEFEKHPEASSSGPR